MFFLHNKFRKGRKMHLISTKKKRFWKELPKIRIISKQRFFFSRLKQKKRRRKFPLVGRKICKKMFKDPKTWINMSSTGRKAEDIGK